MLGSFFYLMQGNYYGRSDISLKYQSMFYAPRSSCSYFLYVLVVELEIPINPAPRKIIAKGSDKEDVAKMK